MDTVTLTQAEYQDLVDSRDHAMAMRDVATGPSPTLDPAELDAFLAAPSPLAFWRTYRGMSQAGLAHEAGIAPAAVIEIEHGRQTGDVVLFGRLAAALSVRIDDIAPIDGAAPP